MLRRYSNPGVLGAGISALRGRASAETRDEPWEPPKLAGTTRVGQVLAADLDEMIDDYSGGMGCVLLSRKYGLAKNTVLAHLKEAGVEVRPQWYLDPDALHEMVLLRQEGWTLQALGAKFWPHEADGGRPLTKGRCVGRRWLDDGDERLLPPLRC